VRFPDLAGLGEEIWQLSCIQFCLSGLATCEQFMPAAVECAVQLGDEGNRLRGDDLGEIRRHRGQDLDAWTKGRLGHGCTPWDRLGNNFPALWH
jgi:hypothetical protein